VFRSELFPIFIIIMFLLVPNTGKCNKSLSYVDRIKLTLVEVYNIVNMLGLGYLHEIFVVHDSANDMRNSMNIVIPKYNTVIYALILVQSYGIYFIRKPNKLLI